MSAERRVHVIDDDDGVRASLGFLLEVAGYVVTLHDSADHFLAQGEPDPGICVVTDVRMPGVSGLGLAARLRQFGSPIPVIVITGHADVPLAIEAMKLGVHDFIEKPFVDSALISAVQSAFASIRGQTEVVVRRENILARLNGLAKRERDVLDGLVAGKSNTLIASDLDISPRTVEVYRANVMMKMKADSLSELVRMSMLADGV